jgi:DNA polymerase III delta prime subunit
MVVGSSTVPLSERLRPTRLDDLVGNPRARAELRAWADQWSGEHPPAQRAAVLYGPAGVGKTSAALALAAERGWTVVEMNASDARNETALEQVAGRAAITHTLSEAPGWGPRRRALILLDEADCLSGRLTETPKARAEPPSLREFLQGRYQTVEALNAAYGLRPGAKPAAFADWEAVPRSPGNASWTRLPAARRDLDEWRGASRPPDLSDRGGLAAITRLVRSTRQPLVLTVNDERALTRYSPVFRTGVSRIRFYPIRDAEIRTRIEQVARQEHLRLASGAVEAIVRRARGDLRAALNDLDAISPLPPGDLQIAVVGGRDLAADLAALTDEVLTSPRFFRSVEVQDRIDAPPDDLLPWVEENIPRFAPDAVHRDQGFAALAVAERFLARARRARVWSQWSYGSEMLTGGVSLALRERATAGGGGIAFPQFLGEMGRSRGLRAVRESIAGKAGARFHLSHDKTRDSLLPFLEGIFLASSGRHHRVEWRAVARGIARELELNSEEVAYLLSVEPDAREVGELLASPEPPAASPAASRPEDEGRPPKGARGTRAAQRQLAEFDT